MLSKSQLERNMGTINVLSNESLLRLTGRRQSRSMGDPVLAPSRERNPLDQEASVDEPEEHCSSSHTHRHVEQQTQQQGSQRVIGCQVMLHQLQCQEMSQVK